MGRTAIALPLVIVTVLAVIGGSSLAQGERPAADATPGAVGIASVPLGGLDPVAAPGYRLQMVELT